MLFCKSDVLDSDKNSYNADGHLGHRNFKTDMYSSS